MTALASTLLPGRPAQSAPPVPLAAAKQRILDTANQLFYEEGIRAVGIDRLIAESSVTKATFYKHFGAKDTLVVEYLKVRDAQMRALVDSLQAEGHTPAAMVRTMMGMFADFVHQSDFRGCPFLNAAAEFPDPRHPVRAIVFEHREWFTDVLVDLLREAGHSMPGDAADELVLGRDGAMAGGYAGDPISASAALTRVVGRILDDTRG